MSHARNRIARITAAAHKDYSGIVEIRDYFGLRFTRGMSEPFAKHHAGNVRAVLTRMFGQDAFVILGTGPLEEQVEARVHEHKDDDDPYAGLHSLACQEAHAQGFTA
jgi:hypothetical protein